MFKVSTTIVTSLTLSLALTSSLAFSAASEQGQQGKRRGPPPFKQLDLNGDRSITLEEFKQHKIPHSDHETVFGKIDSNGDQQISEQEHKEHKPPCPPRNKRQA